MEISQDIDSQGEEKNLAFQIKVIISRVLSRTVRRSEIKGLRAGHGSRLRFGTSFNGNLLVNGNFARHRLSRRREKSGISNKGHHFSCQRCFDGGSIVKSKIFHFSTLSSRTLFFRVVVLFHPPAVAMKLDLLFFTILINVALWPMGFSKVSLI